LACNPDVQKRLREEVDTVTAQHNGQLDLDIIQEMQYLDMVVQGTLNFDVCLEQINTFSNKKCHWN
jgi:hypothetical protein